MCVCVYVGQSSGNFFYQIFKLQPMIDFKTPSDEVGSGGVWFFLHLNFVLGV